MCAGIYNFYNICPEIRPELSEGGIHGVEDERAGASLKTPFSQLFFDALRKLTNTTSCTKIVIDN